MTQLVSKAKLKTHLVDYCSSWQNSDIKGIYTGEEQETKLLQYADDTKAILTT